MEQAIEGKPWLSPFLPTCAADIVAFLDFAAVTADDIIVDIGCGDGRHCQGLTLPAPPAAAAAADDTASGGVGVDVSDECVATARGMAEAEGVADLLQWHATDITGQGHDEVLEQNGPPTVVYLYVYPTLLTQLRPVVRRLCERGAHVVTVQYHFDGWRARAARDGPPSMRLHAHPIDDDDANT
ncbi:hypothetical protein JKP88DRAFT_274957 [Tribonema minus]|uniref:Methyltransferase domain-containing protein n=1 Tax=Tribonema minus TaxID=303371 RepID=A0A836CQJ0_9STRA|nr:hypothetical protein JKP88DRAFT_274957 [Tribonema minus]